ncbi:MAG: tetratricopeptide repeat protein [Acidobacteria bacterium]|nr:tetratricopeptide repeat protein [Acidobacteriota bacterium]
MRIPAEPVYNYSVRFRVGGAILTLSLLATAPLRAGDLPPDEPASDQASQAVIRPSTAAAVAPVNEEKLRAAFDHLYNLEFDTAVSTFEQVTRSEPDSATVCAFYASALLYEILARQGTFQSQLFVTTNEFLRLQRIPPDPNLDRRFHAAVAETERRARARLSHDRNDLDGLFALGLVRGGMANYLAGVKAEYLKGLRAGEEAYEHMKKARELHPEVHDAAVILGVHDYIIGSLPRTHRFMLFFLGASGNRERGLSYLDEAANHGEFLRTYAQVLRVVASVREKRLEDAITRGEDLLRRYPRNPVFMLELAKMYRDAGRHRDAVNLCRQFIVESLAHPHNPRILGPEDGLLELARVEAAQNQFDRALETLDRVRSVPGVNPRVAAQALLERGKLLDQLGRRELAVTEYDRVIHAAVDADLTRQASAYKRRPYNPNARN